MAKSVRFHPYGRVFRKDEIKPFELAQSAGSEYFGVEEPKIQSKRFRIY